MVLLSAVKIAYEPYRSTTSGGETALGTYPGNTTSTSYTDTQASPSNAQPWGTVPLAIAPINGSASNSQATSRTRSGALKREDAAVRQPYVEGLRPSPVSVHAGHPIL